MMITRIASDARAFDTLLHPHTHTHAETICQSASAWSGGGGENSEDTTLDWLVALPQSIHTQTLPCKVPSPPGARLSRPTLPLLYQSSLARCHAKRDTAVTCNSHISAISETGQECRFVVNGRKRISASLKETVLRSSGHFGPVSRGPVQWLDSSFAAKTEWASPWEAWVSR